MVAIASLLARWIPATPTGWMLSPALVFALVAMCPGRAGSQTAAGSAQPTAEEQRTPAAGPAQPLTGEQKWRRYLRSYYDPRALAATAAAAGLSQAVDGVHEWGQGAAGYRRRLTSAYGKQVVKSTIFHGMNGLLGYDPRFFPSERTGFRNRLRDALVQSFVMRDDRGHQRIAYPNFAAEFGSGFLSRAWHPKGERNVGSAFRSGAISFGVDAAMNVLREFIRRAR